jgi:hypothetical protein
MADLSASASRPPWRPAAPSASGKVKSPVLQMCEDSALAFDVRGKT